MVAGTLDTPSCGNIRLINGHRMEIGIKLCVIGVSVGLFNGVALFKSNWEVSVRRLRPFLLFGQSSTLATLLSALVNVPLFLAMFLGLPLLPLNFWGLLPLYGDNYKIFFGTYLVAVGAGKAIRYGFWKWRLKGQLI